MSDKFDRFVSLYTGSLASTRTGALYNAFSYPTKISPESIALFIACHTRPGDHVLDTFAGSGTTGLAAMLCDRPTETMRARATALGLSPIWGPRKATLVELGALGAFVARTMCDPPDPRDFAQAAHLLLNQAVDDQPNIYSAAAPDGSLGETRHVIWSDVFSCPQCGTTTTFWDAAVRFAPLRISSSFDCIACRFSGPIGEAIPAFETVLDALLGHPIERRRRIPVRLYGRSGARTWFRDLSPGERAELLSRNFTTKEASVPKYALEWGDLHRSGYHRGISHLHHFYTPRNLLTFATLWSHVGNAPLELQPALRLWLLSYNASHATLMTRIVVKSDQPDFVITGAQSGVLYISHLPVEKNIFEGVRRKIRTFVEAFGLVRGSASSVTVIHGSSTALPLEDTSVDYVFTDPPFGDYIPYAELSQLNEAWLGIKTDRRLEAVMSVSQSKDVGSYGQLMASVFQEIGRVLKEGSHATVVFHSAKAAVWRALTDAYQKAGLVVRLSSVLDKVQGSFKQVVSTVSVKGDPLILLQKSPRCNSSVGISEFAPGALLDDLINEATRRGPHELTAERLYSRYISRCLELHHPVRIDAAAFYPIAAARINELKHEH